MANTSYTIRPSADGNQYSNYPTGNYTPIYPPSAISSYASGSTAIINWTNNNGGASQTIIEQSLDGISGWSQVGVVAAGIATWQQTNLSNGVYYYRLAAELGGNYSAYSAIQTITVNVTSGDEFTTGWDNLPNSNDIYFDAAAANDSGSGTAASPYKTITLARLQSLSAGKRAWFKNGSYAFVQAITGLASGTSTSKITLAAYPGHTPTITGNANATNLDVQYALGNCAYWDFRNLTFTGVTWCILVGPRQWNLAECPVNHIRFIGCTLSKTQTGSTYTDNSGCIFVDSQSDYIDVAYCKFTGAGSTAFSNNSLLWVDRIPHFKCIGNVFDNCNSLLYYKHNHQLAQNQVEVIVKNNIFSRSTTRSNLLCVNYMQYTNNAHYQCFVDPSDDGGDGSTYTRTGTISNNTFVDSDVLLYKSGTVTPGGWVLYNNLYMGTSRLHDNPDSQNGSQDFGTDTNWNAYTTGNAIKRNSVTRTVAAHKIAFTDQEQNSPLGSTNTINATGSQLLAAYWQLTGGNAIGGGQNGVNCGADYTKLLTAA